MLGEFIQTMQPLAQHLTQMIYPMLNYKTYQGQLKKKIIMNIKKRIINHERKLMEMGGREEILLERKTTSLSIPNNLLEMKATSLIQPLLNRIIVYR
jgi:hypothetical protein